MALPVSTQIRDANNLLVDVAQIPVVLDGPSATAQIGTTRSKFADGFNGSTLDLTKWDVLRNTGGMTQTVAAGSLTVGMGTTNGAELLLVGEVGVTIPANLLVVLSMSQRIAGNDFRFGYLEVDATTGLPVNHATLGTREFRNSAALTFNGTINTAAQLETLSSDAPALKTVSLGITGSQSTTDYILVNRPEDITAMTQASDSITGKSSSVARISTQVPGPNLVYRPFMHFRNTAAPASNTNVILSRVVSIDLQELEVQASMGSGFTHAAASIPVNLTGAIPSGTNNIGVVTNKDVAAVATTAGAAVNAVLFTADQNTFSGTVFQLTGTWVGTVQFQASHDNITFYAVNAVNVSSGGLTSTASANSLWYYQSAARYFRVVATAYTSGSITSVAALRVVPPPLLNSIILASGASVIGGNVPTPSLAVQPTALSIAKIAAAAGTNATSIKVTSGKLFSGVIANMTASWKFFRLYNLTTAPIVGTTVPYVIIPIPPNDKIELGSALSEFGLFLNVGVSYAITGAYGDLDATAVAAGDVVGYFTYL